MTVEDEVPVEARLNKLAKAAWDAAIKNAPRVYTSEESTMRVEAIGRVAAALIHAESMRLTP